MESLPKFVIGRLGKEQSASLHPEANLLTAFAEASLDNRERGSVLEHLVLCEQCREVVALALPELEADSLQAFVGETNRGNSASGWFRFPAFRWGALAAGTLALVLVGVEYSRHGSTGKSEGTAVVSHPDQGSLATPAPAEAHQVIAEAAPAAAISHRADSPTASPKHSMALSPNLESKSNTLAANQVPTPLSGVDNPFAQTDIVKAKDPVPLAESGNPIISPALPLQTSPAMMSHAAPRWAVTSEGALQKTLDGGKTWEAVLIAPASGQANREDFNQENANPVLRAVFASGLQVWAGGVAGALYHSADSGTRWQRISPADSDGRLLEDIAGIESSDPQHVSLTTSSATRWETSDGGQTWRKQP